MVKNAYFFRNLDNFQLNWELLQDGQSIAKGVIPALNIAPRIRPALPFH
nr:DUF4981 domain-containing protein [Paraflavitalea speifideiaquila]